MLQVELLKILRDRSALYPIWRVDFRCCGGQLAPECLASCLDITTTFPLLVMQVTVPDESLGRVWVSPVTCKLPFKSFLLLKAPCPETWALEWLR